MTMFFPKKSTFITVKTGRGRKHLIPRDSETPAKYQKASLRCPVNTRPSIERRIQKTNIGTDGASGEILVSGIFLRYAGVSPEGSM